MKQPLLWLSTQPLVSTGTRYTGIYGANIWSSILDNHEQIVRAAGAISDLRIKLPVAPGAGTSYTFTFMKNGAPTSLTVTISDTNTTGSDMVNTVAVAVGDLIAMRAVPSGAAASCRPRLNLHFEGTNPKEFILPGGVATHQAADKTRYNQLMGQATWDDHEDSQPQCFPIPGTLSSLGIELKTAPGAGENYVFTVLKNGAPTSLAVTITGVNKSGSDTSHTVSISPGDICQLKGVPSAGASPSNVKWGTKFLADNADESFILGNTYPTETAVNYLPLANGAAAYSTTESIVEQIMQEGALSKWYIALPGAPGIGTGYDFVIRKNNTNTVVTITIAGLSTTGSDLVNHANFDDDDDVAIQVTPLNSPQRQTAYYGVRVTAVIPVLDDRIYVYLEDKELTAPTNTGLRGVLSAHTEIGWDDELSQASAGVCQLVVDNHLGDYSPENAGGFFYGDLALGKDITVFEVYKGVRYNHFKGTVESITPHAEKDNQVAFIQAVDGMDELNQLEINTVLRTDTDSGVLVGDILDAAGWTAARDIDTGVDTLQLGWFHKTKALAALRMLEAIENGRFYIDPTGTAIWENRHARLLGDGLVSQHDFEDTMVELGYEYSKRLVYNQFTVRGRRYFVGGATLWSGYDLAVIEDELIYSAHTGDVAAPYIPQNSSLTIRAEFGAPLATYDTIVVDTHWNANTSPDKTGTDVSANISLVQTQYGQSIKMVFTNSGNQGAYLVVPDSPPVGAPSNRTILIYGVLYAEEVMAITEEDAANPYVIKKSLEIDAKFKSNPNDILSYAQYLKARYKNAVPRAVSARHIARAAWPDDTIRIQCLTRHISDRITMKSTLLAFDTDYFINKVVQDYLINQGGFEHETTWSVERVEGGYEGVYWILGVAGYSELGETTVLGF